MGNTAWFVIAGQSLAKAWFTEPGVLAAFRADFLARNPNYTDVQFFNAAAGGSAILKGSAAQAYADNGNPDTKVNYWYDETTGGNGPKLNQFLAPLHKWSAGKTVLGIIWDQGQADTRYVADAAKAALYKQGLDYTLRQLMAASQAAKVYIEAVGDRATYTARLHAGADLMHKVQQDFAHDHSYASLMTATYDLALKDTVHLTTASAVTAARRMADAITTGLASPVFDHAIMARDGKVYAAFSLAAGQNLDDLASFSGFRLNGSKSAIASISVDHEAGLIIITPSASTSHAIVQYASAMYSYAMAASDLFTATGSTGHLPVQPFDLDLARSDVAISARAGSGYSLSGDGNANTLLGFTTNDVLKGGAGDDILDGGGGKNVLFGGTGHDGFVFRTGMGTGQIYDFDVAQDHIDLVGYTFDDLQIRLSGPSTADLRGPHGERMLLVGVAPGSLTSDNFHVHDGDHILI